MTQANPSQPNPSDPHSPAPSPLAQGEGFIRGPLDAISSGAVFRQVVGTVVQVLAGLFLIGFVIFAFRTIGSILFGDEGGAPPSNPWESSPGEGLGFAEGLAAILTFLFALVTAVALGVVAWIRGDDIRRIEDQDFTVMAIAARLVRLFGELALIESLILGVLLMLLFWLGWPFMLLQFSPAGGLAMPPIAGAITGNAFLDGIVVMVLTMIWGFVVLVIAYLIAEFISVLFTIAEENRRTRVAIETNGKSAPSA